MTTVEFDSDDAEGRIVRPKSSFSTRRSKIGLSVTFGPDLRDGEWTLVGGDALQQIRSLNRGKLKIDFSSTNWADPLPLLWIACAVSELEERAPLVVTEIDLGGPRRTGENRFLVYLATQGFLAALGKNSRVRFGGIVYPPTQRAIVANILRDLKAALAFSNADAIHARVFHSTELSGDKIPNLVETLINEAHRGRIQSWLPSAERERGLLLHKLRVTLSETLDNIGEHAYSSGGFGALYARIRLGMPDIPTLQREWVRAFKAEHNGCSAINRRQFARQPGWIEVFVCDLGVGIASSLVSNKPSPLYELSDGMFKEPYSKYPDRAAIRKTSVTGLQRIGHMLEAISPDDLGDFVRVYSNGEWVGEHLPWPKLRPAYVNHNRRAGKVVPGTALHFALQPATFGVAQQRQYLPAAFVKPPTQDLAQVRSRLALSSKARTGRLVEFIDLFKGPYRDIPARRIAVGKWLDRTSAKTLIIRPARTNRKVDLRDQVEQIAEHRKGSIETLIYADLPGPMAIDSVHVLEHEAFRLKRARLFKVILVTQDWCCAAFTLSPDEGRAQIDLAGASQFLSAGRNGGPQLAAVLRDRDTELFWNAVSKNEVSAFLNEPVIWKSGDDDRNLQQQELPGYLDLSSALADSECADAARRAIRRCLSAFASDTAFGSDELAEAVIDEDFERAGSLEQGTSRPRSAILVGSVRMTGSTSTRAMQRRDVEIAGVVNLFVHPMSPQSEGAALEALLWTPPNVRFRTPRQKYERIMGTPYVIRGGEAAIPIPRFRERSGTEGSLYGETPAQAYHRWQQTDLLRMGHWTYGQHHDLLTIKLIEALQHDKGSGSAIQSWVSSHLRNWRSDADRQGRGFAIVYPRHRLTDRLVRLLKTDGSEEEAFFPVHFVRSSSVSPVMSAPLSREKLWRHFNNKFKKGGTVVILDDGVISGRTLEQLTQHVEGVWELSGGARRVNIDIKSVALLDRTGLPTQRGLVERRLNKHPRYWRWDVPTLGQKGSCPLCASLMRARDLQVRLAHSSIEGRLSEWLESWRTTSVVESRPDAGLAPVRLPTADRSRFGIDGSGKAHFVHHQISTSRAALAAEIARSTTRKDYPLKKATSGRSGDGIALDIQTRIEILATQCFLFWDELDFHERVERLEAMLDLLWQAEKVSTVTALAGLTLLLDSSVTQAIWPKCAALIEERGFPNNDALIAAYAHYRPGISRIPDTNARRNWSLLHLLVQPTNSLRGALGQIFSVLGWDQTVIHRARLADLLKTKEISGVQVGQITLLLQALSHGLRQLAAEPSAPELFTFAMQKDIDGIAGHANEILMLVRNATLVPLTGYHEQSSIQVAFDFKSPEVKFESDLRRLCIRIYEELFVTDDCVARRYRRSLTSELPGGGSLARSLLWRVRTELLKDWPDLVAEREEPELRERWHGITPEILFDASTTGGQRPLHVYFDAKVQRAVRELMANVIHATTAIENPWGAKSDALAHLWLRAEYNQSTAMLEIEMINGAAISERVAARRTPYIAHLLAIGGMLDPTEPGTVARTKIYLPTLGALFHTGIENAVHPSSD